MGIKLAIFDGEGVIYSYKRAAKEFEREYKKFLKGFGVDFKEQARLWFRLYPKIVRGKITLRKANEIIYKKFGIPKSKVREWLKRDREINIKFTRLNKGARQILLELKAQGIRIAILSDTVHPLKWRLELFKKFGLVRRKHYDKLFLSNRIGYEKPEKEAYLTVLRYFGVKPEEAVFIGHDKEEIEGAKKHGIKTISHLGCRRADFYVKNLREIPITISSIKLNLQ